MGGVVKSYSIYILTEEKECLFVNGWVVLLGPCSTNCVAVLGSAAVSLKLMSNKKNTKPYKAGPRPLQRPLIPVTIPCATPAHNSTHQHNTFNIN